MMEGPLFDVLIALPVFVAVLLFLVTPVMQWLSRTAFDSEFIFRFGRGDPGMNAQAHRRDVVFSIVAVLLSLGISYAVVQTLILEGILPPFG